MRYRVAFEFWGSDVYHYTQWYITKDLALEFVDEARDVGSVVHLLWMEDEVGDYEEVYDW